MSRFESILDHECSFCKGRNSNTRIHSLMRVQLPTHAEVSDKYGVSYRSHTAIAATVQYAVLIVSDNNTTNVIGRSNVRRTR